MERLFASFWFFLILLSLSGCAKPLEVGSVVDKSYEEERYWVDRKSHRNKVGDVTWMTYSYDLRVDDEDWILVIEGWNDKEKLVREVHYVSRAVYEDHKVGDRYRVGSVSVRRDGSSYVRTATADDRSRYPIR